MVVTSESWSRCFISSETVTSYFESVSLMSISMCVYDDILGMSTPSSMSAVPSSAFMSATRWSSSSA